VEPETEIEWDEAKRLINIEKHHIDFIDCWEIFENDYIQSPAKFGVGGEERFAITGIMLGLYVTGIFTMRGPILRVISLRRAHQNERKKHQEIYDC
jgi:uncharacterized DUF497 family protein